MGSADSTGRLDHLLSVLCNPVRRRVLYRLYERRDSDVTEVSTAELAADEDDCYEATLHHAHLPKLDQAGYVDWDGDRVVRPGDRFDEVEPFLDLLAEHHDDLPIEWP